MNFNFTKPADKRYVDLCMEFDKEFYTDNRDDTKLFSYMFLLFKMFAYKGNYFKNNDDYGEYAMFAATTIYMRYLRKWEKGEKIKSVLNYIKTVKGPLKVTYQNENFGQVFDPTEAPKTKDGLGEWQKERIRAQEDSIMRAEMSEAFATMPELISEAVSESPFAKDAKTRKNLEVSCLLTFLDRVTPPSASADRQGSQSEGQMLRLVSAEGRNPPILWKIAPSMASEVEVVLNKAKTRASADINEIRGRYTLPDDVVDDILSSAYSEAGMGFGERD